LKKIDRIEYLGEFENGSVLTITETVDRIICGAGESELDAIISSEILFTKTLPEATDIKIVLDSLNVSLPDDYQEWD
jgi:hypothetical protein